MARALAGSNGKPVELQQAGPAARHLVALPPVGDFAAAAAADGGPVALIVRTGRTRRDVLQRSVRLLRTAGSVVVGSIVVCERERQKSDLWT